MYKILESRLNKKEFIIENDEKVHISSGFSYEYWGSPGFVPDYKYIDGYIEMQFEFDEVSSYNSEICLTFLKDYSDNISEILNEYLPIKSYNVSPLKHMITKRIDKTIIGFYIEYCIDFY